ncbi:hypothetical protein CARUB_v10018369mg [Capsella rubella]|uniref:Uncharacterized protein n=1 Tax=Capsella rubella TaxID=81985 RepID=R0FRZ2_9BRAS|nr:hypothetical protein CARUB_v10018369mg [Capsella rubella]
MVKHRGTHLLFLLHQSLNEMQSALKFVCIDQPFGQVLVSVLVWTEERSVFQDVTVESKCVFESILITEGTDDVIAARDVWFEVELVEEVMEVVQCVLVALGFAHCADYGLADLGGDVLAVFSEDGVSRELRRVVEI